MSSSNSNLSPYPKVPASKEKPASGTQIAANRIAGTVQTCSIIELYVDYFKIVRDSPTSYHICLTVDPMPIYRIVFVSDSTEIGDIQIFHAFDDTLPAVAAARLSSKPKGKNEPVAMICTSQPYLPDALWRPLERASMLSTESYQSRIPIVMVPGIAPNPHQFAWRTGSLAAPFFELWWEDPLPFVPEARFARDGRGSEYVFATLAMKTVPTMGRKTEEINENLIQMRRGGGLEFELSVLLELFVILRHQKKQLI